MPKAHTIATSDQLRQMHVPKTDMLARQRALKALVLSFGESTPNLSVARIQSVRAVRRPAIAGFFASIAVALLLLVGLQVFYGMHASQVEALAFAKISARASAQLPLTMQRALKRSMGIDIVVELKEAQTARDLTLLTYQQARESYPYLVGVDPAPNARVPKQKRLAAQTNLQALIDAKFLQFTDHHQRRVLIAINAHAIPITFIDLSAQIQTKAQE